VSYPIWESVSRWSGSFDAFQYLQKRVASSASKQPADGSSSGSGGARCRRLIPVRNRLVSPAMTLSGIDLSLAKLSFAVV